MCLAIPALIKAIGDKEAEVDISKVSWVVVVPAEAVVKVRSVLIAVLPLLSVDFTRQWYVVEAVRPDIETECDVTPFAPVADEP